MFLFNSQRPIRLNLYHSIANMTFFLVLFQCLSFAPQLVQKLAAGFDPEQACTAVKMCVTEPQIHIKPVEVRDRIVQKSAWPHYGQKKNSEVEVF